jgi:hypothetical protein
MPVNLQVDNVVSQTAQSVKDQGGNTSTLSLSVDRVGIGTTNPQGKLDVHGNIVLNGNAKTQLSTRPFSADEHITVLSGDIDLIKARFIELDMSQNGSGRLVIGSNPDDNMVFLFGFSGDRNRSAEAMWLAGKDGGRLPILRMSADRTLIDRDVEVGGDIRLANADCAEDFTIGSDASVEPGTVMVLGEEGALFPSYRAYDKRVAGVVSGAGDYKPGIVLDKQESDNIRQPIALLGKAYCKVDAGHGAIEIGDLLTTSPTPGHAMKADDPLKAFGTVIGKALRPLAAGQGLIPILIALQ